VGKGAKIAIGCGIAAVLAVVLLIGGVVGLGYWGKRKLQNAGFDTQSFAKMAELQKKAQALPFTAPSDGVIAEDRFLRFIEVRKAIFPIFEKHRAVIEQQREKRQKPNVSDVLQLTGIVSEVQKARLEAMLEQGMGSAEYQWLAQSIYQAQIGARVSRMAPSQAPPGEIPAANLALFQKYQADIDRYAMPELALIGM